MNKFPAVVLILCGFVSQFIYAQGNSHSDPAGIGVTVNSIIQIGSVATSNYDVAITVQETVRGDAAFNLIKASDEAASSPGDGHEYLLASIRFELNGRTVSETSNFALVSSPFQWVVYSSSFSQYDGASIAAPDPALKGSVASGETKEGWLVFEVEQDDAEPMLMFDPSTGGAQGRGKKLFFKLY